MDYTYDVEAYEYKFLGIDNEDIKNLNNPLTDLDEWSSDNFHLHILKIMRNPKYMHWTVKVLLNIDLLPEQVVIMQELWTKSFPMYIASRGFGKSFLLAVYATLRCLLVPESKIVIVGAAFRQSKVIFEYMDVIWRNAPILQSLCSSTSGPRRDVDRCTLKINDSWTIAVPLGDGSKIRGLRAHTIIADEFNCLGENTLVETKQGLIRIGDTSIDHSELDIYTGGKDILTEKLDKYIVTPPTDVYEIKFDNGYIIKASENHKLMTQDGWKSTLELTDSDYIESNNNYVFPEELSISEKMAWLLGILVSEGSVVDKKRISIKTTNERLKNFIVEEYGFKVHERKAYKDKRKWNCKRSYEIYTDNEILRDVLYSYGLEYVRAINKKIPNMVLKQPKHIIMAFLDGLFEGDGSAFLWADDKGIVQNRLGCAYYSVSETLCRDVQVVLNKLGYDGYINNRESEISDNLQWFVRLNGKDAYDFTRQLNIERFDTAIENCYIPKEVKNYTWDKSRNKWKTSIKHCGKKIQKRYDTEQEAINAIKDIKKNRYRKVVSVTLLPEKEVLYDYHLPITHSFYAGSFRNHNSIPVEIYETVVAGFASVSKDPTGNVKLAAKRKAMQEDGVWTDTQEETYDARHKNQSILSGTAGYDFEPYADYWRKYKLTIHSKGDLSKISRGDDTTEVDDDLPEYMKKLNWKEFCVIRIPYELIPEGFMDDQQVSRSRATMHSGIYLMEYGACFAKDSQGFFKRTLIESCVAKDSNVVKDSWPEWCPAPFDVITRGHSSNKYVFAIDPASEVDNLALIIMELHGEHQRVVYSWTTNKKEFQARKRLGLTDIDDYYSFVVRKIRDLMQAFPCVAIGIDSQGGGVAIAEGLRDKDKMRSELNEMAILEIIDEKKEKDTDRLPGLHILEFVNFASAEWTSNANHGLRKDMEDKRILFPRFDQVTLGLISTQDEVRFKKLKEQIGDSAALKLYDTLEDVIMDIEDLKAELCTIMVTRTASGREKFDTPEIKLGTGKKGRMRKDRYSALVIANMIARSIHREIPNPTYGVIGRVASSEPITKSSGGLGQMYIGQDWATVYDANAVAIVRRN